MSFLDDILKRVKRNTLDRTDLDERLVSGVKALPSKATTAVSNYFKPESNQGSNFWSTKPAQALGKFQTSVAQPTIKQATQTYSAIQPTIKRGAQTFGNEYLANERAKSNLVQSIGGPIGRAMQKVPQTEMSLDYRNPLNFPKTAYSFGAGIAKSYGKSLERLTSPQGRAEIVQGAMRLPKERLSLQTLDNPAVSTALDVTDFVPAGLIASTGISFLKRSLRADDVLKYADDILDIQRQTKNIDQLRPADWMTVHNRVAKIADELIPSVVRNKEMKRLAVRDPNEWLRTVEKYLTDGLVEATEMANKTKASDLFDIRKIDLGASVKPIRRMDEPIESLLKTGKAGKEEMITLYHASPNMPTKGNWRKGTYLAKTPNDAMYYATSHHSGNVRVMPVSVPKSLVSKEGNYFRLNEAIPISQLPSKSQLDLAREANAPAAEFKDMSGFSGGFRDVYRNFKAVFGKNYDAVKAKYLDPFDKSKGAFIDEQKKLLGDLNANVVNKLNIKKGSKESAAIQEFGEGNRTYASLVAEFGQKRADDIVQADQWFRTTYDRLLNEVNAVRARIYPNNPDKIIPKRQDYYRHFREMGEGIQGLKNIFETPAGIASKLSGVSEYTKPKSKWLSFAQRRTGEMTDIDAVGGFLDYIKQATYAKHIDPHAANFQQLAKELKELTAEGANAGKLNNFTEFLEDFARDLTGKTNPADRVVQKWIPGGRQTFRAINWLNNRVKANTILGNASSSLAQIFNVPQGIADAGPKASAQAIGDSLASIFTQPKHMKQSNFLKERFFKDYDQFDTGMLKNAKKFAAWMTGVLDEVGTRFIWNAEYRKALDGGIANPIKFADDATRRMVAGRGIGEVPLAQKAKTFQLIAPFQLEVANVWWVMKDWVDEKAFSKLATFAAASFLFNRAAEEIRGSDVSFDPINAAMDALETYQEADDKGKGALMATGRLAGEVLSNVPLGQTAAAIYPEYGVKIGDTQLPTRSDFFGEGDPTRFGSGLLAAKGLQDPLFKVIPPFGGQQIKRTIEGLGATAKGFSETASDRVRFPIDQSIGNFLKAGVFGQYSLPEARQYFNAGGTPLGGKQSEQFKMGGGKDYYQKVMDERETNRTLDSYKENLSGEDKPGLLESLFGSKKEAVPRLDQVKAVYGIDKLDTQPTSTIEKVKWEKEKFSLAKSIWDNSKEIPNLTTEEKQQLVSELGVDPSDMEYYSIASETNDIKFAYLYDLAQGMESKDELLSLLIEGRRKVGGSLLASDGVIDELYYQGLLTSEERKYLKNLKHDPVSGKVTAKAGTSSQSSALKKLKAQLDAYAKLNRQITSPVGSRPSALSRALDFQKAARQQAKASSIDTILAQRKQLKPISVISSTNTI